MIILAKLDKFWARTFITREIFYERHKISLSIEIDDLSFMFESFKDSASNLNESFVIKKNLKWWNFF